MTATAAGVLTGVALLAAILGISSTSSSVLAKLASSSPETVSTAAPRVTPQRQTAKVSPARRAPSPLVQGKSRIVINAKQGSWIDGCADGHTVFRRFLPQSSTADLEFSNIAVVRTGNAGGVEISVNGKSTGPVGALGQVQVIGFDAGGFHLLEEGDPGSECGQ